MNAKHSIPLFLLVLTVMMSAAVSAAVDLQATNVSGSVTQAQSFSGSITVINNGDPVNLTITVNDLISGANTISASDISISPSSKQNVPNGQSTVIAYSVNVAAGQATGSYIGTVAIEGDNGTQTSSVFASVQLTVNQAAVGSITFSDVVVGGENQEREETVSEEFTISNDGIYPVTGLAAVLSGVDSDYEANVTLAATTIPAGGSVVGKVTLYIPDYQDAGEQSIGDITITGSANGQALTTKKDLSVETENHLVISKVEVTGALDGDKVSSDGDEFDFDKDEEPRPGEKVTLEITLENTFSDSIDIEDITITVTSDDLDWDEDDDISKIKDDDKDSIVFELEIDEDADEDTYDIEIEIEGEDENGAKHGETWTVRMEVSQIDDDLRIDDLSFSPSYATCSDRSVTLRIDYKNVGSDDQSKGVIRVSNEELDIEKIIRNIEIDEGDDDSETVSITLPSDVKAGSYIFEVEIFTSSNDDDLTDVDSIALDVRCDSPVVTTPVQDDDEEEEGTVIDVVKPTTPTTTTPSGNVVQTVTGQPSKSTVRDSELYITLLIAVIVLLIILISLAAASLLRKK